MDDILREIDQHGLDSDQLSLMAVIKSCDATHRFGDFGLHAKVEAVLESLKHKAEHAVRDLLMHGGNGNIAENLAAAKKLFEDLESKLDELELKMVRMLQSRVALPRRTFYF